MCCGADAGSPETMNAKFASLIMSKPMRRLSTVPIGNSTVAPGGNRVIARRDDLITSTQGTPSLALTYQIGF
jgi:hypothetical protein